MIPLSRFARMLNVDRQTDRLWCVAVHCSALQKHRRTLPYHCGVLRTIMVHCSELQKRCERLADHCGALGCMRCMYHTLRWSASHTKPPCNNSGTLRKRYRKLGTTGTLVVHCDALQCIAVHCGASSTCCGGVHHTLTETPNSIHLPHHPANPQKLTANP